MDDEELPEWSRTAFWALVLVFNVALLVTAVGVMVLYFEGERHVGGWLVTLGLIAWAIGLGGYLFVRRRLATFRLD
ncbi:MAG: DUF7322 domain-containing protein [Halobacteriota archaeon]